MTASTQSLARWFASAAILLAGGCGEREASTSVAPRDLGPEAVAEAELERARSALATLEAAMEATEKVIDEEHGEYVKAATNEDIPCCISAMPSRRYLLAVDEAEALERQIHQLRVQIDTQVLNLERMRAAKGTHK